MAFTTMATSFLATSAVAAQQQVTLLTPSRKCLAVVRATGDEKVNLEERSMARRNLVLSAAAVAATLSGVKGARADDEPQRGTIEAKKKYASICVTMPTAKVCRK